MAFLDEEILEFRRNRKKATFNTLDTGMYIRDEMVYFEETKIFDGKVSVILPDNFVDMPENLAKLKYPSEHRPQIIKTSLDTTVNFTFNLIPFKVKFPKEAVEGTLRQWKGLVQKINPAYIFYDLEVEEEGLAGWFDFKSYGIDEQIYNIVFLKIVEDNLLQGIFNCEYRDVLEWKSAAMQIIRSVREYMGEENNER